MVEVGMTDQVYIETSVIGAYFEERSDTVSAAQRYWTRIWWNDVRLHYSSVISQVVIDELSHHKFPHSKKALDLVEDIEKVAIKDEIKQIANIYIHNQIMPKNPLGDAMHLALASYHKCDFLLTWNCKHIANPNKFKQIRLCNNLLGLFVPTMTTPNQLIGDYYD